VATEPAQLGFAYETSRSAGVHVELQKGRVPELDGLRGLAILLVLVWHYAAPRFGPKDPGLLGPIWVAMGVSWTGVDLFFVLSGFLIGGILLDNQASPNYFTTFYIRRVCRIFPLYYLLIFSLLLVESFGLGRGSPGLTWLMRGRLPYWAYTTFTQNVVMIHEGWGARWLAVTWSLAVEEQFYLVLPLLIRMIHRTRMVQLLILCILIGPASRLVLNFVVPELRFAGLFLMPCRADTLLLGVLGACVVRSPEIWDDLCKNRRKVYALFGVLLAGFVLLMHTSPSPLGGQMNYWGRSWVALFYLILLLIPLIDRDGFVACLLRSHWLRQLGVISYGVYMLHEVVLGLIVGEIFHRNPEVGGLSSIGPILIALVVTILAATILYHLVEKPILRVGHSYKY